MKLNGNVKKLAPLALGVLVLFTVPDAELTRPGGIEGGLCKGVCADATKKNGVCTAPDGSYCMDDCCCFVASASGLESDQIRKLRGMRDTLNETVPGFKQVVSDTYGTWGPAVAKHLRRNSASAAVVHGVLSLVADSPYTQSENEKALLRDAQRRWEVVAPGGPMSRR